MNNGKPLVSVIINCFNGDQYLQEAIDSIYAQTYTNWEIIFWDNGSSDNSASIAKSYDDRLRYFHEDKTAPLGEAKNLALMKAKGDYVSFLDSDDIYLPDKINIQVSKMQAKKAILSYGSWIKINADGEEIREFKVTSGFCNRFEELYSKYIVNSQTLMIDNNYLKEKKITFDKNLKFASDHNIVMKIAYEVPVMSISNVLAKYRVHNNSLSKSRGLEKYKDMEYTKNYFKTSGAEMKFKDFNYFSSKAIIFMRLRDSFSDRDYKGMMFYSFDYLMILCRKFSKKIRFF